MTRSLVFAAQARSHFSSLVARSSITLAVVFLAAAAHALPFTNLIVLGDSIVDQGNTQAAAVGNGFPDPAPARMSSGPSVVVTARACSGLRARTISSARAAFAAAIAA